LISYKNYRFIIARRFYGAMLRRARYRLSVHLWCWGIVIT